MLKICDENGLQKPRYVQGSYSLITRGMESKLLPIMRPAGMSFVGHQYVLDPSPIAPSERLQLHEFGFANQPTTKIVREITTMQRPDVAQMRLTIHTDP